MIWHSFVCTVENSIASESLLSASPSLSTPLIESEADLEKHMQIENAARHHIQIHTFEVKMLKSNSSQHVYLFEVFSTVHLSRHKIFLVIKDQRAFVAFRVLESYPEEKTMAAKKIRIYEAHDPLMQRNETFQAILKVADFQSLWKTNTSSPSSSPTDTPSSSPADSLNFLDTTTTGGDLAVKTEGQKGSPLKDLKVLAYDAELDGSTSPSVAQNEEAGTDLEGQFSSDSLNNDTSLNDALITIEENHPIDHYDHWLTAGFSYLRNLGPRSSDRSSYYFTSGNVRYGYTLIKMIFYEEPRLQDSLVLEGGCYFYKNLNFASIGDAYSIFFPVLALRYNLFTRESFAVFFYGGLGKGFVLSGTDSTAEIVSQQTQILPLFGVGLLFEIGPAWYMRTDFGLDNLGVGIVLKF